MPLDKPTLKAALLSLMTKSSPMTADAASQALADAIEGFVQSGTVSGSVSITNALVAPPSGGPVTGTSSGSMTSGSIS